jgi:hypothetical protein
MPDDYTLDGTLARNSLSLSKPSPVTLDTENIGVILF